MSFIRSLQSTRRSSAGNLRGMIRREEKGKYYLIRQDDHATLAGELAQRIGAPPFESVLSVDPVAGAKALTAVTMHDAGWPIHDDSPTLNNRLLPRDVFESKHDMAMAVWTASGDRAAAVDPYVGLLVSLHSLSLSAFALAEVMVHVSRKAVAYTRERFDLNRFQHNEIERQTALRQQLGFATDLPLNYGLASPNASAQDDLLTYHFRVLQGMDRISLALCCTKSPFDWIELSPAPGQPLSRVRLQRSGGRGLLVSPWIFNQPKLTCSISARVIPIQQFKSEAAFAEAFASAPKETMSFTVEPGV